MHDPRAAKPTKPQEGFGWSTVLRIGASFLRQRRPRARDWSVLPQTAISILCAVWLLAIMAPQSHAQQTVPAVAGRSLPDAERLIKETLHVAPLVERASSTTTPSGVVVETRPAGHTAVTPASPVTIVVSVGPGPGKLAPLRPIIPHEIAKPPPTPALRNCLFPSPAAAPKKMPGS